MKIDPIFGRNYIQAQRLNAVRFTKQERAALGEDTAEISREAMTFSKALAALREGESASSAVRIAELKTAVDSGVYNVDSGKIADRILAHIASAGESEQ